MRLERIEPGKPQQNGRHERMHRTLKQETALPPRSSLKEQQEAFDRFRIEYNLERPHEALEYKTPEKIYIPSERVFPIRIPEIAYATNIVVETVLGRDCQIRSI
ncbi:transposase [Leptospira borgpetersenii]|nr:transposase [Leptospira borgpetersenii]